MNPPDGSRPPDRPRVCIVTPGQIGANPRVVKEATALDEAGFQVTVIATRALEQVEPRDQALMRRIRWRLRRVDLRSRWRWRLRRALQIAQAHAHSATRLRRFADFGFSAATRPLSTEVLRTPADLYIAHYPAALPAAAMAARRHGGRYAYDAEDFHLGDWPDCPDHDSQRRLVRTIEARYLPGCEHVTAASQGIADAYVDAYGVARPVVVLNVFPLMQAPQAPTSKGMAEPGPSLYWFSQMIGPDRGLECAVRAVGLAKTRPHLYLRGTPVAGFVARLEQIATEFAAVNRLHILPPAEPDEMARLASAYDLGLASENGQTQSRAVALTNKLFTFLLAGVPPLLSDTPAQRAFAESSGLLTQLYPVDGAEALASLIDRLLGDPARLAAARAQAYRLGRERYNWERESEDLLKLVRRSLERGAGRATFSSAGPQ